MSGDSPNAHRNEVFDFKEGRSSPIATSSKEIGVQSGTSGVVTASVLVEPNKEAPDHSKVDEEHVDLHSTTLNNTTETTDMLSIDAEKTLKLDDSANSIARKSHTDDKKKLNGDYDKLDGVWNKNNEQKNEDYDEDNCIVQCLYYSMQCCDCAIM